MQFRESDRLSQWSKLQARLCGEPAGATRRPLEEHQVPCVDLLLIGSWVELRHGGRIVRTGEVEDATADSSVLWLKFDGNHGRQLVAKADGYEIRRMGG